MAMDCICASICQYKMPIFGLAVNPMIKIANIVALMLLVVLAGH